MKKLGKININNVLFIFGEDSNNFLLEMRNPFGQKIRFTLDILNEILSNEIIEQSVESQPIHFLNAVLNCVSKAEIHKFFFFKKLSDEQMKKVVEYTKEFVARNNIF